MLNRYNLLYFSLVLFFSLIFCEVILVSDSLRHFNKADKLVNNLYSGSFVLDDLISEIPFWIIQNSIIIFFFDLLEKIFIKNNLDFFSNYFISFLHSFYVSLSFYLCFKIANKKTSKFNSLIISLIVFFGTGLIYFFSSTYIENLIILLFILRIYFSNKYSLILIDIIFCLIKPYYYIFVIFFNLFDDKKIFKKNLHNLNYLFLLLIFQLCLFFLGGFSYLEFSVPSLGNSANFDFNIIKILLSNYYSNFINIFFSNSSGVINTLLPIMILVLFGFNKSTKYKIIVFLIFALLLSLFNFWYSHLPMSGRYILSIIPFFLKEIINGFIFFYKKKKSYLN